MRVVGAALTMAWLMFALVLLGAGAVTTAPIVDLNGDGNGDVFTYSPATGEWARQVSLPGGGFTTNVGQWAPGWTVVPASIDGDALTDFFLFSLISGHWFKMVNDGVGFTPQSNGVWWPGWDSHVMDLNGDGLSDLFLYDSQTGQWFKCLSTSTGFDYFQGGWRPGWEVYPAALNTDAFGDLFLIDRATGLWFWVQGEADGSFTYPQHGYWAPDWILYGGDVDGDGRDDWFLYRPDTGEYYVATNNGAGYSYVNGGWAPGWRLTVADLDADGLADLFLYNKTNGWWFELQGNGAGQFATMGEGWWIPGWELSPSDFDGDSRADLLLYKPGTGEWYQARNETAGEFTYLSGQWQALLSISAAVSVTGPPQTPAPCLVTTSDLTIGNTVLALNDCGAAVGGNLAGTNPSAAITGTPTPHVNVAGTCSGTCGAMGTMHPGSAAAVDPLAGLAAPVVQGPIFAPAAGPTLLPGIYSSIASSVTTLLPGNYYVSGTIDIGNLTGTEVLIYLHGNGNLRSGNNSSLTLTAATAGTYRGIAIFQDRSNSNGFSFGNNFSLSVSGAIYMPGVDLDFPNALSLADTGCTLFIARSVNLRNASGTLTNDGCSAAFGGAGFFLTR